VEDDGELGELGAARTNDGDEAVGERPHGRVWGGEGADHCVVTVVPGCGYGFAGDGGCFGGGEDASVPAGRGEQLEAGRVVEGVGVDGGEAADEQVGGRRDGPDGADVSGRGEHAVDVQPGLVVVTVHDGDKDGHLAGFDDRTAAGGNVGSRVGDDD
jgi:hypothetical protein